MARMRKNIKKVLTLMIGLPLLIAGIILIPIPGPGLLVSFIALLILATEFSWASQKLERAKNEFKNIYKRAKERADRIQNLSDRKK